MINVTPNKPIAYFCAEFGLESDLPLYAGGLGILAGDTLKQAADENIPVVAVGLFYRGGKAKQGVDESGMQYEEDFDYDPVKSGFEHVYVPNEDQPLFVRVHLTTEDVWARVWKRTLGSVTLYLLDTDTDQNQPEERDIAKALYWGSEEDLIKQQMLLGIGGVKLLDLLEIHPSIYHVNEGRPAFLFWQLIRQNMEKSGLSYEEAYQLSRSQVVYTNHTLVRAGNQSYERELIERYSRHYADSMGVSLTNLLEPAIEPETGRLSLTQLALNASCRASSVSQPHFELSKSIWPEYDWVNITNGVHLPTWQDADILKTKDDPAALWEAHRTKKRQLMELVQSRTGYGYDPDRLVVVWARRIVGYKRLHHLFEDLERLKKILNDETRPVQLLISGKAHPGDTASKEVLQQVIQHMQQDLAGHALYLPDYNMTISRHLVSGADIWVNTPVQGQEASGTSGMKAIANGVLQLTVEDGWASEVDWAGLGWTLDPNNLSQTFYFRLEDDIIPRFYKRNEAGLPEKWLLRMQASINLAEKYSTKRMFQEYRHKLYQMDGDLNSSTT